MINSINSLLSQSSSTFTNKALTDNLSFKVALNNFYELHQRAQITGVSTSKYNEAVTNLGIDTSKSSSGLDAINLLKVNGYDTDKPQLATILKYGVVENKEDTKNMSGNKSYMSGGLEFEKALKESQPITASSTLLEETPKEDKLSLKSAEEPSSTSSVLSSSSNNTKNITLKEALDNFYELHQQSQVSGVSTSKYNAAVESLGIDTSKSSSGLEAINLLKVNGYDTGKPKLEAILKYGTVANTSDIKNMSGNKSYMSGGIEFEKALSEDSNKA